MNELLSCDKMMNSKLLSFFLLVAFSSEFLAAQSADSVAKLQQSYKQAINLAEGPIRNLNRNYVGALGKLKEKLQKEGNLENVLLIQNEIVNYAKVGERDVTALAELQRLREIFDENSSRVTKKVRTQQLDIMMQAAKKFEQLTADLTKLGDLEAAVQAKGAREAIVAAIEEISGAEKSNSSEPPAEEEFEEWLERVIFLVVSSGTTFKYRKHAVEVVRTSGWNEKNKAKIRKRDQQIEFEATAGPAYIQVAPDRKSASYFLRSRIAGTMRVIDPKVEK